MDSDNAVTAANVSDTMSVFTEIYVSLTSVLYFMLFTSLSLSFLLCHFN